MPIYEYVCHDCETAFERYVKAWSEPVVCEACHSANVEKRLSTFAMTGRSEPASRPSGGGCCGGGGCGCR